MRAVEFEVPNSWPIGSSR